ncbi:hypothetical protein [Algibacter luteus]|jgi:hypothetical protein|uniref:Uncharacterized protein n=1 Tax=Algibacter luteus TaxID=1178825 RepID=A0A1M6BMW5_9FLAO|nr:hypothetical protein [Algibacter luteus]WJJ95562.1 hypothetical protein O5O44_10035 [Algibacter luteus]SHI50140.1 hypothetical protein SAMN05216261_0818 [Algibacter luteus]
MLAYQIYTLKFNLGLITQSQIVTLLVIVTVFFGVLLLLGVRKSYLLKKENERLDEMNRKIAEEEEKPYKDFTEGHMYGDN